MHSTITHRQHESFREAHALKHRPRRALPVTRAAQPGARAAVIPVPLGRARHETPPAPGLAAGTGAAMRVVCAQPPRPCHTALPQRRLFQLCHLTLEHLGGRVHRAQPALPLSSTGLAQEENE